MQQHTTFFKNNQKQITRSKKPELLPARRQMDSLQPGRIIWRSDVRAVSERDKSDPVKTFRRALYAISFLLMLLFVLSARMAQAKVITDKDIMVKLRGQYGWASVFNWPVTLDPCPDDPDVFNWNRVNCADSRIRAIQISCGND